ncbi:hypothetical protein OAJ20_04375 [Candidatus Pelagibacter sp.]|nr:hypothetical protein [Candidatus Pelagibacter sp.]
MATTIKHYRNSFLDIQNEKIRIFLDPWVNTANEGSWAASKKGSSFILNSLKKKEVDFIYISHLHTDHFDVKFLKLLKKKQKKKFKLIIKKFRDNRLKNQLINSGFEKNQILDVNDFETLKLNEDSNFIILPQISSSNTPNEYIKYDLDTSCIFFDKNVSLYNQVDNPYSLSDLRFIMKKLKKKVNIKFDLGFIPYCAASEFPQSFINLNRIKEKKNVINSRINKFINIAKVINCRNIIPAGGSYLLDNIFSGLNKYLAVPSFQNILRLFKKYKFKDFDLINTNKHYFFAENKKITFLKNDFSKNFTSELSFKRKNIGYNKINQKYLVKSIKATINNLENSMPDFKKKLYDKTDTKVELCVWGKQPILIKNLKNKKNFLKHEIKFSEHKKATSLKIHIYYKLLLGIIKKVVSWNEVQNHCLFERKPNKYEPDTIFWLNLYKY